MIKLHWNREICQINRQKVYKLSYHIDTFMQHVTDTYLLRQIFTREGSGGWWWDRHPTTDEKYQIFQFLNKRFLMLLMLSRNVS